MCNPRKFFEYLHFLLNTLGTDFLHFFLSLSPSSISFSDAPFIEQTITRRTRKHETLVSSRKQRDARRKVANQSMIHNQILLVDRAIVSPPVILFSSRSSRFSLLGPPFCLLFFFSFSFLARGKRNFFLSPALSFFALSLRLGKNMIVSRS